MPRAYRKHGDQQALAESETKLWLIPVSFHIENAVPMQPRLLPPKGRNSRGKFHKSALLKQPWLQPLDAGGLNRYKEPGLYQYQTRSPPPALVPSPSEVRKSNQSGKSAALADCC